MFLQLSSLRPLQALLWLCLWLFGELLGNTWFLLRKQGGSGCMFPAKGEDENKVVKGDETVILIMKLEEEIIVMVVAKVLKKEKRGLVRAWTMDLRYRGKEVGKGILEHGVDFALGKGCREIVFVKKHANPIRVLPAFSNRTFDRREQRARKTLAAKVATRKGEKKFA